MSRRVMGPGAGHGRPPSRMGGLPGWIDDRLRGSHFLYKALNKVFPDH